MCFCYAMKGNTMDKLYKFKGNYDHRSTDTNPTLYRDMMDYLDNQNSVLSETVNAFLWQPDTDYIVGTKVITKAMPKGCIAECIAKGTSGKEEPTWVKGVVNDNGIEWKVYNPTEYDIKPTANSDKPVTSNGVYNAIDTAVSDAHHYIKRSATYAKGDVLTSPELPYDAIIEVTQAGTSGADEPDWSTIKDDLGKATDEENSAIATLQKTIETLQTKVDVLTSKNAELERASKYHVGDTYTFDFRGASYVTGAGKYVQATVFWDKPIGDDVKSISLNDCIITVRQNGKYIIGSGDENVTVSGAGLTTEMQVLNKGSATVYFYKDTAFADTNNSAVGLNLLNCTITFGG